MQQAITAAQQDQVDQFEHERIAQLEAMTVAELIAEAKGIGITKGVSDARKAQLVKAIAEKNVTQMTNQLVYANADVEAQAAGFNDRYQQTRYEAEVRNLEALVESDPTKELAEKLLNADPADRGNILTSEVRWGAGVEGCVKQSFARQLLGFVEGALSDKKDEETGEVTPPRFTNPAEALAEAKQVMLADSLLNDYWTASSSSEFANAVENTKRHVASNMLRRGW